MGALVAVAGVPVGGGVVVHSAGVVVTQPTTGEFHGFEGRCTHLGCRIGSVAAGLIQCPCHGSRFAIVDGSVVHGPAVKPLPTFPIRVTDGYVYPA
jgi:Rieske Fe-S protein